MLRHFFDIHNGGRPGHKENGMKLPGDARLKFVAPFLALMRSLPRIGMFTVVLAGAGPAQATASSVTFVQAATRAGTFQTFLGLIDKAQAAERLNAGPATVFMPTDAAFAHLTSAQRDTIAALSPDDARRFVSHFVVPGVAMRSNNIDQDITAEDGTSYNVTWFGGRLSLRDHRGPATGPLAFVVDGDAEAGSSMIDAVDSVLMPAFLDRPTSPDAPITVSAPPAMAAVTSSTPPSDSPASNVTTPVPAAVIVAPAVPAASTTTSATAPSDVTFPEPKPAPPSPPPQPVSPPSPSNPIVTAEPSRPDINITTADLRGWPVRTTGNGPSGKVDRVVVGVPSGRIAGLTATFGGFFGFGGKRVFIAWPLVTIDLQGKTIRVRMTADGLKSAPSSPPAS